MKKISILIFAICLAGISLKAEKIQRHNIFFDDDSYYLTVNLRQILDTVYDKLPEDKSVRIGIMGKVNAERDLASINRLEMLRAEEVLNYYKSKGVEAQFLEIIDRALNERKASCADCKLTSHEWDLEVEVHKKPVPKQHAYTSIENYFPKNIQHFTIDPTRDSYVQGEQGTRILFRANTLECADGSTPGKNVSVELKEFYNYADFLKGDLHTMSYGGMLETGGTINIIARCENSEARLKASEKISIEFPVKGEYQDDMLTFNGVEEDGELNWVADETSMSAISESDMGAEGDYFWLIDPDTGEEMLVYDDGVEAYQAAEKLDNYLLDSYDLGWINCDRFIDEPYLTDFTVEMDTTHRASVRMVFKNIRSVTNGWSSELGKVTFSNIPVGETVTIVAYSIQDEKPYMAMKDVIVKEDGYDEIKLMPTTKKRMENQLLSLK